MEKRTQAKPLRVGFNGRPFCQDQMRGLGRHTLELIKSLKELHPEMEFYIYAYEEISSFYKKELPFAHFRDQKIQPKILWDLWYLGRQVQTDQLDIFHSTNNLGVPFIPWSSIPIFTTIHDHFTHDARMPMGSTLRGWWAGLNYRIELYLAKRSNLYFTVSENARKSISQKMHIPMSKIKVAYNGVNLTESTKTSDDADFYLYVGGLEERKNIPIMLSGFKDFSNEDPQHPILKIVGNPSMASAEVRGMISKHPQIFQLTGSLADVELTKLYQQARALIFPSLEEGFGLPLVEAMKLGCAVIASDIEVFREIAADSALYFEARNPKALKARLEELKNDPQLQLKLVTSAYKRADLFTWKKMAEVVYSNYCQVLDS